MFKPLRPLCYLPFTHLKNIYIYHIQYPNICLWSHKTAAKYSVNDSSQMSRNQTDISPSYRLYFSFFFFWNEKGVFRFCLHFDACGHHFRLHIAAARWTCNSVERGQQRSTFPPGGSPLQRLAKVTVRWSDVWQLIFFFYFFLSTADDGLGSWVLRGWSEGGKQLKPKKPRKKTSLSFWSRTPNTTRAGLLESDEGRVSDGESSGRSKIFEWSRCWQKRVNDEKGAQAAKLMPHCKCRSEKN